MPKTNVEIYQRILEAFNREGIDGVLAYIADDVEVYEPDLPSGRSYRGPGAVREVAEELMSGFDPESVRIRDFELLPAGDRVVAVLHTYGRGESDEVEVEMRDAHTATFRDGKIVHWRLYLDPDEAIADAGLPAR